MFVNMKNLIKDVSDNLHVKVLAFLKSEDEVIMRSYFLTKSFTAAEALALLQKYTGFLKKHTSSTEFLIR